MDGTDSSFSSSFSRRWTYDVFLSFSSKDTGRSFTNHLFTALKDNGISTFADENEVQGEEVAPEVAQVIQKSRMSVIVFSRNYASSRWRLEELVSVIECRKTVQQKVLPIFYDVDPSDVRKQTGHFAQAFTKHEASLVLEMDKVARWREALTEAANLSGWDLRNVADGHEVKFIKKIVEEISREMYLSHAFLFVALYPVGLDARVQVMADLLDVGSHDVRMVGICGMGGVGKTTLAKAVHNHFLDSFESKIFLADVRETSRQPKGLVRLQERLLSDTLEYGKIKLSSVDHGIYVIKERLCNRKVLVILDDVDHLDQLNALAGKRDWFGTGSRIIITTRDEQLLKQFEVDEMYMVEKLSKEESLELFSWHTFRRPDPIDEYLELSNKIVAYSEMLPLALVVLGSFLFKRSVAEWKSALDKLKRIPHTDIQKKIRISFDALNSEKEKDIFLDIACFLIGINRDYAITILDGCGFSAETGIRLLIHRCLLTVDEKNKLMMHDLVRDMGREIVREESLKFPERCSRLWREEDVLGVLQSFTGTETVEGMLLNLPSMNELHVSSEAFARMSRLRLLKLNYVHVTGGFGHISKELRWLHWHKFSLNHIPADFHMGNLAALDMRQSNLKQMWKDDKKFLGELKVLNLSHSPYLIKTPDFRNFPKLEKLVLKDCRSLTLLHQSIEHSSRLVTVNLRDCKSLKSLPSSISKLKHLEILNLFGCSKVDKLPEDIGEMESLIELIADGTLISQVPSSIVRLKNLRKLSLSGCNGVPSNLAPLRIWSWLSTRRPKSSNLLLPPSLSGLDSLTTLCLSNCRLPDNAIPRDIGTLSSLRDLDLRSNNFHSLPASFSNLPKLERLQVDNCPNLQHLPELPKTLMALYACDCPSLKGISSLSNFEFSPNLFLTNCSSLVEIPCLENLSGVVHLEGCNNLRDNFRESFLKRLSLNFHGVFYLPGSEIPSWFHYRSRGSSVSFLVPPLSHCIWRGFTLCCVYAIIDDEIKEKEVNPAITFINKSRGSDLTFKPYTYQVPNVTQDQMCLYHLPHIMFGNQLKDGEQLEVLVDLGYGLIVKKCGIYLVLEQGGNILSNISICDITNQGIAENAKRSLALVDEDDDGGEGNGRVAVGPGNGGSDGNRPTKRLRSESDHDSRLNVDDLEDILHLSSRGLWPSDGVAVFLLILFSFFFFNF